MALFVPHSGLTTVLILHRHQQEKREAATAVHGAGAPCHRRQALSKAKSVFEPRPPESVDDRRRVPPTPKPHTRQPLNGHVPIPGQKTTPPPSLTPRPRARTRSGAGKSVVVAVHHG